MATRFSAKVPNFVSLVPDKLAIATDAMAKSPEVIISFIAEKVFVNKASTGIIESYRTALCSIIEIIGGKQWGNHPLIARAIRAAKRLKPIESRYTTMWNAKIMWDYCANNPPSNRRKEL